MLALKKLGYFILGSILWLYCLTWRYRYINKPVFTERQAAGKTSVVVLWHDQILPLTFPWRNKDIATIASDSNDGDLITSMLHRWRFKVARGSSSKGGLKALVGIKKFISMGYSAAVTVDGPIGPRHKVKSGAIFLAKITQSPIIPVFFHSKHVIRFDSWDKFILPLPFAKIDIIFTDPIECTNDTSAAGLEADRQRLEKIMLELTNEHSPDFV